MRALAPLGTLVFAFASAAVGFASVVGVVATGDVSLFVSLACLGMAIFLSLFWLPASIKTDLAEIDIDTNQQKF